MAQSEYSSSTVGELEVVSLLVIVFFHRRNGKIQREQGALNVLLGTLNCYIEPSLFCDTSACNKKL
jgi:hypothetical protein